MGAIGPKRVKMNADGACRHHQFELVDNEGTWLTKSDLVFIDPVGTGYSRPSAPELGQKFFGLQGDIESVGEFIRMYLTRYERWTSPLFLAGESYGTTRASALSGYLIDRGIAFNGIMLISTIMNFETTAFAPETICRTRSSCRPTPPPAWYHKKLPSDLQSKPVARVVAMRETLRRANTCWHSRRGSRLSAQERQDTITKLARFTGPRYRSFSTTRTCAST
jgi:carboxypeptidase C (cathepsin A)